MYPQHLLPHRESLSGGTMRDINYPINNSGSIHNLIINSQTTSTSRLEFNVQECIQTFFGREEFIKKLHENISNIRTPNPSSIISNAIMICGLGGVGKTQVVRKYIQEHKAYYGHILWINAESKTGATSNFLQLAKKLRIDVNQDGKQNTGEDTMEDVYDVVCKQLSLLVYDNMEPTADGKDGIPWMLPKTIKSGWKAPVIIITSRNRDWVHFQVEELQVSDSSESLSFLSSLEFEDCEDNRILLQEVVKICQGLPLALQQVVAFVRNKRNARAALHEKPYNLEDFLNDVAIQRKKFLETRPEGVQHPDLFTLFDMTFEHILSTKQGTLTIQCLDVMAILNPDHISTELIQKIFNHAKDKLAKVLNLLSKFGLITRCDGYYQMHRMIQAAINESRKTGTKYTHIKHNFYQIVATFDELVENLPTNYDNVHQTLDNVIRIYDFNPEINTKKFQKYQINLAEKLTDVGNYIIAIKIYIKTVNSSKLLYGTDHQNTQIAKGNLANLLRIQGKYDDAVELNNAVLEMSNKILGPDHPNTL